MNTTSLGNAHENDGCYQILLLLAQAELYSLLIANAVAPYSQ